MKMKCDGMLTSLLAVVLFATTVGIGGVRTRTKAKAQASAFPAKQAEQKEPVIALWNNGAHMINLKPFLLFAAWEDGTVIRRLNPGKPAALDDWANSKLACGSVTSSEVLSVQAAIAEAGFFRPPLDRGLCFIDGPSQSLCVRYGKAHRLLEHHGRSDKWLLEDIETMGSTSFPSRKDSEDFVAMWERIMTLVDTRCTPVKTTNVVDELRLCPPQSFDATDENGDPSIAYYGIPEYKKRVEKRGLITMTTVQMVNRDKYQELKSAGSVENEERHGDWLYFAVSGLTQIPNDTASIGVTYRYKVQMR